MFDIHTPVISVQIPGNILQWINNSAKNWPIRKSNQAGLSRKCSYNAPSLDWAMLFEMSSSNVAQYESLQ